MRNVVVAVPFYRNSNLVKPMLSSLLACRDDLTRLQATVIAVIDSPEDRQLIDAVNSFRERFLGVCPFDIIINEQNLGFIRSVNLVLARVLHDQRDVLLLNSDALAYPGALSEMHDVAYSDHMIGFVSPRSNNATICSLPYADSFRDLTPEASYDNFLALRDRLPRLQYVPVVVGFAMYIKFEMVSEFGFFDLAYGMGYNEENDLIMRANRCGYRAAIANHAFVYHEGEKSFGLLAEKKAAREALNSKLLNTRFPEYERTLQRYFSSAQFKAYRLLDSLVRDGESINVAFDLRHFRTAHNGTFEAAIKIMLEFKEAARNLNVFAICSEEVFAFHRLHEVPALKRLDQRDDRLLAAIIRIGQPFRAEDITWLRLRAPVVAIFMLDTIALDCAYLDDVELERLWRATLNAADIVLYNSSYTRDQFNKRFVIPEDLAQVVALHSTDVAEYSGKSDASREGYILVVGNEFQHKFVQEAVRRLREAGSLQLMVLGVAGKSDDRVRYVQGGNLTQAEVDALYQGARCVCFPSHYEGFGFPVVNALAHRRPIVARDMPVYGEIADATPHRGNIHLFKTSDEMIRLLQPGVVNWTSEEVSVEPIRWRDTAEALSLAVSEAVASQSHARLEQRIRAVEPALAGKGGATEKLLSLLSVVVGSKWKKKIRLIKGRPFLLAKARVERQLVKSSIFFDEKFYKEAYGDVSESGVDCAKHFCSIGWKEGRNPSIYFDASWYISKNSDVARSGMNPLVHYLCYGLFERRPIKFLEDGSEFVLDYVETRSRFGTGS
ncbi:glycosyltransferase [Ensifer sp. R-19]|uniref:glycosyltransferase n=1 Tax=Ensifer sp. R-19 TaxID=3404055 RepID=UPI003CFA40D8